MKRVNKVPSSKDIPDKKMTTKDIINTDKQGPRNYFTFINESKFLIGLSMILLNVFSKYVDFKFSKAQEQLLRDGIAREIIIFTIAFLGTRDIVHAILLTAAFIILSEVMFNEKSKYCIAKKRLDIATKKVEVTGNEIKIIITPEEEAKALDVLRQAEKQRNNQLQKHINNYMIK